MQLELGKQGPSELPTLGNSSVNQRKSTSEPKTGVDQHRAEIRAASFCVAKRPGCDMLYLCDTIQKLQTVDDWPGKVTHRTANSLSKSLSNHQQPFKSFRVNPTCQPTSTRRNVWASPPKVAQQSFAKWSWQGFWRSETSAWVCLKKKTVTPCYPKIQGLILMFPLKRPESEDHSLILEHNKPAWQIFTRTVVFRAIACKGLTATKCKTTGPQWIECLKQ